MKTWVMYACLVAIQAVAPQSAALAVEGSDYKLVEDSERVGGNRQPGTRYDRIIFLNRTPGDWTAIPARTTPKTAVAPDVQSGWVKCPCEGDCDCIDEQICKDKNCKKNYVVVLTAKWCSACPRMKRVADELITQGYIVYVVDFDKTEEWCRQHKITHVPTTIVFDGGKEVKRFVGVTSIDLIKDGLKNKAEQTNAVPAKPYQF